MWEADGRRACFTKACYVGVISGLMRIQSCLVLPSLAWNRRGEKLSQRETYVLLLEWGRVESFWFLDCLQLTVILMPKWLIYFGVAFSDTPTITFAHLISLNFMNPVK